MENKFEVKGMIPAEVIKNKDLAKALKQALSLDVKDGSPEERKARITRRQLICKTLGISAKNIDKILSVLDSYIAQNDSSTSSDDSENPNKTAKDAGNVLASTLSFISNFIPALKVLEIIINGVKLIIDISHLIKDFVDADSANLEVIKILMEKVDILNKFIDKKLKENPEILNNPKEKKKLLEELKKELKASGVEIKSVDIPAEKEA